MYCKEQLFFTYNTFILKIHVSKNILNALRRGILYIKRSISFTGLIFKTLMLSLWKILSTLFNIPHP